MPYAPYAVADLNGREHPDTSRQFRQHGYTPINLGGGQWGYITSSEGVVFVAMPSGNGNLPNVLLLGERLTLCIYPEDGVSGPEAARIEFPNAATFLAALLAS